jgi:hypothetical protein
MINGLILLMDTRDIALDEVNLYEPICPLSNICYEQPTIGKKKALLWCPGLQN